MSYYFSLDFFQSEKIDVVQTCLQKTTSNLLHYARAGARKKVCERLKHVLCSDVLPQAQCAFEVGNDRRSIPDGIGFVNWTLHCRRFEMELNSKANVGPIGKMWLQMPADGCRRWMSS